MNKSSVQTFLALRQGHQTLSDFKLLPKTFPQEFKYQTQILAQLLFSLWTAKPDGDDYHYQGLIHNQHIQYKGSIHSLESIAPEKIHAQFLAKNPSHLGTLTLLHLLLGGLEINEPLFIIQKKQESTYYFCQKLQNYWQEFFSPNSKHIHLFSQHPILQRLGILINTKNPWWQNAMGDIDLRKMLMPEFFETFLRIYLTPWRLIQKLAHHTIDEKYIHERKQFLNYLEHKIERLINEFEQFLSLSETLLWQSFLRTQSHQSFENFLHHYNAFFLTYPFHQYQSVDLERLGIVGNAFHLGIPGLDDWITLDILKHFTPEIYQQCFEYTMNALKCHWNKCERDANHLHWQQLNDICQLIPNFIFSMNIPETSFSCKILFQAVQFQKNHIARVFLCQAPHLRTILYPKETNEPVMQNLSERSLYFVALIHQNEEILHLLDSFAVGLNLEDMEPLKIYIFHCIDIHATAQFSFIVRRYPSVLSHINQDFLPFRKILETYCQSHAQDFLNLIPEQKTMRYSLFQLVSLSSSSESEDEKIVNFKKPVKISYLKK